MTWCPTSSIPSPSPDLASFLSGPTIVPDVRSTQPLNLTSKMFSYYATIATPSSSGEKDEERLRLDGMVMRTLKNIPETTPTPKLAEAAKLALQISVNAQVR